MLCQQSHKINKGKIWFLQTCISMTQIGRYLEPKNCFSWFVNGFVCQANKTACSLLNCSHLTDKADGRRKSVRVFMRTPAQCCLGLLYEAMCTSSRELCLYLHTTLYTKHFLLNVLKLHRIGPKPAESIHVSVDIFPKYSWENFHAHSKFEGIFSEHPYFHTRFHS